MKTTIASRANALRSLYAAEMGRTTREHSRGNIAASREHYAAAQRARSELNALGFDLFGAL